MLTYTCFNLSQVYVTGGWPGYYNLILTGFAVFHRGAHILKNKKVLSVMALYSKYSRALTSPFSAPTSCTPALFPLPTPLPLVVPAFSTFCHFCQAGWRCTRSRHDQWEGCGWRGGSRDAVREGREGREEGGGGLPWAGRWSMSSFHAKAQILKSH